MTEASNIFADVTKQGYSLCTYTKSEQKTLRPGDIETPWDLEKYKHCNLPEPKRQSHRPESTSSGACHCCRGD